MVVAAPRLTSGKQAGNLLGVRSREAERQSSVIVAHLHSEEAVQCASRTNHPISRIQPMV